MSTCNRLDLQTLGSQPIMPKTLPEHCPGDYACMCAVCTRRIQLIPLYAQESKQQIKQVIMSTT